MNNTLPIRFWQYSDQRYFEGQTPASPAGPSLTNPPISILPKESFAAKIGPLMKLLTPPTVRTRPLSGDKRFLDIHHNFGLTCQFFAGLFERLHLPDWKGEGGEWIEQPNFSPSCLQPEVRKHQQHRDATTTTAFTKWATSDRGQPSRANDNCTQSSQKSSEDARVINTSERPSWQSREGDTHRGSGGGPTRGVVI